MRGLRLTRWLRQRLGFMADARGVLGSAPIALVVGGDPPDRAAATVAEARGGVAEAEAGPNGS